MTSRLTPNPRCEGCKDSYAMFTLTVDWESMRLCSICIGAARRALDTVRYQGSTDITPLYTTDTTGE